MDFNQEGVDVVSERLKSYWSTNAQLDKLLETKVGKKVVLSSSLLDRHDATQSNTHSFLTHAHAHTQHPILNEGVDKNSSRRADPRSQLLTRQTARACVSVHVHLPPFCLCVCLSK